MATYTAADPYVVGQATKKSSFSITHANTVYLNDNLPRGIYDSLTPVTNVGAGETNLMSTPTGIARLAVDGDKLRIMARFTLANNGNAKLIKFYFGATPTTFYNLTTANVSLHVEIEILRLSATTQVAQGWWFNSTFGAGGLIGSNPAETLSGNITAKFTGTATNNADISNGYMGIVYWPKAA